MQAADEANSNNNVSLYKVYLEIEMKEIRKATRLYLQ